MSSLTDFALSVFSDALLPFFRQAFEDVVYETLNDRKVPTRTDFIELRDLVNRMRGQASSAVNKTKKLDARAGGFEEKLAALTAASAAQEATIASLRAQLERLRALEAAVNALQAPPVLEAPAAKKPAARKPAARKPAAKKPAVRKPAAKKAE